MPMHLLFLTIGQWTFHFSPTFPRVFVSGGNLFQMMLGHELNLILPFQCLGGTLNVKFGIYVRQTTIFRGGIR
jgi:hypothetical protein